jgi:hypothetical protein
MSPSRAVSGGRRFRFPYKMSTLTNSETSPEREVVWDRYKKEVMAVLIVALLGVAAYGGYKLYSDHRENAAATALAGAKSASDFQKVITEYPNTPAGETKRMSAKRTQRCRRSSINFPSTSSERPPSWPWPATSRRRENRTRR